MPEQLASFWCRIPSRANFGDALTPWLIERLTGVYPKFRAPTDSQHKFLVTGSVIGLARAPCTVWGAGIMQAHEVVNPGLRVRAVRGPLTRARVLAAGIDCPPVYGDPALLLPRLYAPDTTPRHDIGLVLHFSDRPRLKGLLRLPASSLLIDIQDPIEKVIDDIASCRWIASSSLHGLIVAHAYGRPAVWIEFKPLPSGDGSKFRDYLLSVGCEQTDPVRVQADSIEPLTFRRHLNYPPEHIDLEPLLGACPFEIDRVAR